MLNTDFGKMKTDLGRMFGFAYGHKENGAVFCHMAVMYGYALYSRGFVSEGFKVMDTLYGHGMDFEKSHIYPGIPEYFNVKGRGMYHYLTGAASWYILTVLTQMYGISGWYGDLLLHPKLVLSQFDKSGKAQVTFVFADRKIKVVYENRHNKEIGDYEITEINIGQKKYIQDGDRCVIRRKDIESLDRDGEHQIMVVLA